jgi:2-polyprenyl-3-methyl-5-hydroxy-6-metoxy-1,4-benzoquinol methylase
MIEQRIQWEEPACAWCGSTTTEHAFSGPDRLARLPGLFFMVRCTTCGLYRQSPRPAWESLKNYYPEDYAAYSYDAYDKKSVRGFIKGYGNLKRRRAIESFQYGGQLLEVGCGTGSFLKEMQRTDRWDCVGIEPNQRAASFAQESLDLPIYHGRFSDITFKNGTFDVIVLWCVLEHLDHPVQDIQKTHSLLKKGGWFIFTIPNYESLGKKLFGKYWSGWDLPRHMYIFPRPVLHQILEECGFQVIEKKCIASSYYLLGHSLDFWSQSWVGKFPAVKKLMTKFYYSWAARLVLLLPLAILDRLKLSTNITIFARKKI